MWTYGGSGYDDAINNIQASDGTHIIVGLTESSVNNYDLWIFKVAQDGSTVWRRVYDGGGNESAFNAIASSDGGYTVVGTTTSLWCR